MRYTSVALLASALTLAAAAPAQGPEGGVPAVPPGGGGPKFFVKLFLKPQQKGLSLKLTSSDNSITNSFNNNTRSVQVYGRWKLCSGVNLTGTCKTFSSPPANHELPANLAMKVSSVHFLGGV